jgi:hypothetical protein
MNYIGHSVPSLLMNVIEVKKQHFISASEPLAHYSPSKSVYEEVSHKPKEVIPQKPAEHVLVKTLRVPFDHLHFHNAHVSFSIYIEELRQEVTFTVQNNDIRVEFEAIKAYFIKVLKKKLIIATVEIRYTENELLSATATSEDIEKINQDIIDNVRFEFVKREILFPREKSQSAPIVNTIYTLINNQQLNRGKLYQSEQQFIDDLLAIKNSKHYQHLQFLSSKHLSSVLKIRFVLEPFSFLFLLAGDVKYHIIWETLNSEEATYIWHFDKILKRYERG